MPFIVPEKVIGHFHLRQGDSVGDFGAGSGFFTAALSRAVGSEGRVYLFEIQKTLVEHAAKEAERLGNVDVLWCDMEAQGGCKLADGILDAAVLANTLFQLEEKGAGLAEIRRLLRQGGKLLVIDWSHSFSGMGPKNESVVREEDAKALAEQHGFRFECSFPAGEHHYGLAFRAI